MGIPGLLPLLNSITRDANIAAFAGKTVGVDGYCWLHRGCFTCAWELCQNIATDKYVTFFITRVRMLLANSVTPIIVFDGRHLPMKAGKEEERRQSRELNRAKGVQFLRTGNRAAAVESFQKCVDVTPAMAAEVARELRRLGVEFYVAPYEADAQLAYLFEKKLISAVITEDSDLLPFGCTTVFFKMDKAGNGKLLDLAQLAGITELNFVHFTSSMFTQMCILSGCDYTPSIKGMGLKKAHRLLCQCRNIDQVLRMIRYDTSLQVPPNYEQAFRQAVLTFAHQSVYCPFSSAMVPLHPYPEGSTAAEFEFAGPFIDAETVTKIARCEVDPFTLAPFPNPTSRVPAAPAMAASSDSDSRAGEPPSSGASEPPAELCFKANLPKPPEKKQTSITSFFSLAHNTHQQKPFHPPRQVERPPLPPVVEDDAPVEIPDTQDAEEGTPEDTPLTSSVRDALRRPPVKRVGLSRPARRTASSVANVKKPRSRSPVAETVSRFFWKGDPPPDDGSDESSLRPVAPLRPPEISSIVPPFESPFVPPGRLALPPPPVDAPRPAPSLPTLEEFREKRAGPSGGASSASATDALGHRTDHDRGAAAEAPDDEGFPPAEVSSCTFDEVDEAAGAAAVGPGPRQDAILTSGALARRNGTVGVLVGESPPESSPSPPHSLEDVCSPRLDEPDSSPPFRFSGLPPSLSASARVSSSPPESSFSVAVSGHDACPGSSLFAPGSAGAAADVIVPCSPDPPLPAPASRQQAGRPSVAFFDQFRSSRGALRPSTAVAAVPAALSLGSPPFKLSAPGKPPLSGPPSSPLSPGASASAVAAGATHGTASTGTPSPDTPCPLAPRLSLGFRRQRMRSLAASDDLEDGAAADPLSSGAEDGEDAAAGPAAEPPGPVTFSRTRGPFVRH